MCWCLQGLGSLPRKELAGAALREKADRLVGGVITHPFLSLQVGYFFSQNPEVSWQKEGSGGERGDKAPESGDNVSPVSEDTTSSQRPWVGFLQQKKTRGYRWPLLGALRPLRSWV